MTIDSDCRASLSQAALLHRSKPGTAAYQDHVQCELNLAIESLLVDRRERMILEEFTASWPGNRREVSR